MNSHVRVAKNETSEKLTILCNKDAKEEIVLERI